MITRPLLRWWVAWAMETRFSTRIELVLAERGACDVVLVLDEVCAGAFGIASGPPGIRGRAAGARDASRLRLEVARALEEGTYFRLSTVQVVRRIRGIGCILLRAALLQPPRSSGR